MADPKYAGLPGIASDQPDTYETSGEDGEIEPEEESGEEVLHLSSLSWLGDLELVSGGGVQETIVQRYARLRCEVGELTEELDGMAESQREAGKMEGLHMQVTDLRRQLESCQVEERAGSEISSGGGVTVEQLAKDIQGIRGGAGEGGGVNQEGVYQLYLTQEEKPSVDLAVLDKRLAEMELVVGLNSATERRVLSSNTDDVSLAKAVDSLANSRGLLNQQHIDHVEGRLAALSYKMNAIAEQKTAVAQARQEDKLMKLLRLVEGQATMANVLPDLVNRLEAVEALSTSSKGWTEVLDWTQQNQANTGKVLKETKQQVEETKKNFETTLVGVADKFADLQKKLKEICV